MKRDKTGRFTQAWNGESKQAVKLSLTHTAWQLLEQRSREMGVSRSELVERYARHLQCHCCAKNKIASSNGEASSLSQAVIAPDTQAPETLLVKQIAALQQQNGQLQNHIAQLQQRVEVLQSQKQLLCQITAAIPPRVWTFQPNGEIEEQLKESQRFIQQVANATPGILYIYDLIEQRNVYVNRQIEKILGYTTDETQAMGNLLFPTLMHPDELATLPAYVERFDHAQDGEVIEREYRMRHANGEWRWLWSRDLVFSRTEAGTPHQIIGISHDITDRKQAEFSLRATEERLSLVLQATNDAIYDRNLKTDSVWWNSAYDQLVGKRPLECNSSRWWVEHVHPDDRDRVIASFEAALTRGDERWSDEYRYQRADGHYANVIDRAYILRDGNGVPERYLGAISDVTHIKQVEEDLKQMEERLQLALSSARMVAWDVDLQTNQVVYSPNALDVWGIQAGTAADFFSSVHPEDRERVIQALEQARAGKEQYCQEYRITRPDQTISWLNSQGRVHFGPQGQATRFVGVSVDISDRKRADQAAAQSTDRTARLQAITAALAEALTPSEVSDVIIGQAVSALGACRGLITLLKPNG